MSRENTLILVGILVALSPFSGLPHSWLSVLTPLLGVLVAIIGFTLHDRRIQNRESYEAKTPSSL